MFQTRPRSAFEATVYIVAALVGFVAAVPLLGVDNWPLELLVSFRLHLLIGLVLVALVALLRRHRLIAAAVALAALINAGDVAATYFESAQMSADPTAATASPGLKLLFANVLRANGDHGGLLDEIARRDPDVIVLVEVTQAWDDALAGLASAYPYELAQPREHAFGMVLLSRSPLDEAGTEIIMLPRPPEWESDPPVALVARIETASGPVTVVGVHPFPPLSGAGYALRNFQLDMMADLVAQQPQPVMAVGDFNATPWSPALRRFIKQTGLRGPNIAPTWPALLGPAGLPIDHVLISRDLRLLSIERGAEIGSDHRPLFAVVTPQGAADTP